ncbi:unnamed protein product [Closterium sp. Naga37s-1]|nr:unnamed protein product [Closterium sp. Naga37s-1]
MRTYDPILLPSSTPLLPRVTRGSPAIAGVRTRIGQARALAAASSQGGAEASGGAGAGGAEGEVGAGSGPRLVIYSREGCCLCDGLKEKIDTALMMGTESSALEGLQIEEGGRGGGGGKGERLGDGVGMMGERKRGRSVGEGQDGAAAEWVGEHRGSESTVGRRAVQVEVRDITARQEWMEAYQYEIPVMMRVTVDQSGNAVETLTTLIPRQSLRASVERVRKALETLIPRQSIRASVERVRKALEVNSLVNPPFHFPTSLLPPTPSSPPDPHSPPVTPGISGASEEGTRDPHSPPVTPGISGASEEGTRDPHSPPVTAGISGASEEDTRGRILKLKLRPASSLCTCSQCQLP